MPSRKNNSLERDARSYSDSMAILGWMSLSQTKSRVTKYESAQDDYTRFPDSWARIRDHIREPAASNAHSHSNHTSHPQWRPPLSTSRPLSSSSNNPFLDPTLTRNTATSRPLSSSSNNPFLNPTLTRNTATSHSTSLRSVGPHDDTRGGPPASRFDRDDNYNFARRLQGEFDSEDRALLTERNTLTRYTATTSSLFDRGLSYAQRLQDEFDNENHKLTVERINLSQTVQQVFECGICMEKMPEDSVARPDPCRHAFCRECMRGYVSARLEEHRFPILCPTCTASKGKGKGTTGEVSQHLALTLGLTDEQFSIWTEMEMIAFSVLLHCRKCQRSMFVAKDEHHKARIIACPLPDCNHAWCKQCQKTIDFGGPQHSCDGTTELDHLMKKQGWKYCPSCKTPIQKVSGCNHMSCITPACNTHFCYLCGRLIVKSALGQKIKKATSSHFRSNCTLFEVPGE